jgi:hypothetical protein
MANEPASAVLQPETTAAGTVPEPKAPERNAGTEGAATPAAETHLSTNHLPEPAGNAAEGDGDRLVAGLDSVADIQRLTGMIPAVGAVPAPGSEESTLNPEDVAGLGKDGALPKRLRIASLPEDRQRAIVAMADPNRPIADILRDLAGVSAAAAPEAVPAAETAPASAATPPATTAAAASAPDEGLAFGPPPKASADVRTQIAALRKDQSAALRAADMDKAADLNDQIAALENDLPAVVQAERQYGRAFDRTVEFYQDQAAELFPDVRVPGSDLAKEMIRIDELMKAGNHPAFHNPDKPLTLTLRAAANLGISARAKTAAAPAAATPSPAAPAAPLKPAPVSALTPRAASPAAEPPAPAAGGARTAPPASAAATSDTVLASTKDTNDILRLTRSL